jgi:hypothetical protein
MRRASVLPLVAALLAAAIPALAAAPAVLAVAPPPVRVVRLAAPITVDGSLDEPAWQGAPAVTRLVQGDPVEYAAPSESTWIWVACDDEAIYFAARNWDSYPDSVVAHLVRRDVSVPSDRFMVYLDPFHDRRSGYYFGVNAAGVLYDGTLFNDGWDDDSWDGVWSGRARRDAHGWTVEMRIPYSQLRYRAGAEQTWGINFKRRIERRIENDWVVFTPKKESGFCSRFPELTGIRDGQRSSAVEVLPYVTGKGEYLARQAGDPFHDGSKLTPGMGGDLRMGVGNSLTLNASVNPDFGQVEVDPAVVNLSDVETYFQEKRPFFTENARIFSFGNEGASDYWGFNWPEPTFFYSRRIGRTPQGAVPDTAEFSDAPLATHILGAAKLTGKLAPSWNFGMLHALTSRETARFQAGGLGDRAEVEPLTYYGLVRGQKEFAQARNGLGAMTTLVQRRFGAGGLDQALDRQSLMTGLDGWHFLDQKKIWVVSGWAAMSRIAGTRDEMIAVQSGSRHYLQRPDARNLGVDSSATSLTGGGVRLWLNKQGGGNTLFNSALGFMSPGFDVNDMGFMSRADVINGHVGGGRRWTNPGRVRRYAHVIGAVFGSRDFDGNPIWQGLWSGGHIEFLNNYTADVTLAWNPETVNNRRTRGGPLTLNPPGYETNWTLATDVRRPVAYSVNLYAYVVPESRSSEVTIEPAVEWKPAANVSLSAGPGVDRNLADAQYVSTVSAPAPVPADFGGQHYVFARLDQTTVYASIRLNVSFTPGLSLQTYLQPLISAVSYGDFKELARSRSYDFIGYGATPPYGIADPSFNSKSLRGNAVLRWEYRPGSVLYLVWTQERTDSQDSGDLNFGPSTRRLLDAHANDIFLVKGTYYFSL